MYVEDDVDDDVDDPGKAGQGRARPAPVQQQGLQGHRAADGAAQPLHARTSPEKWPAVVGAAAAGLRGGAGRGAV